MPTLPSFVRRGRGLSTFAAVTLGFMVLVILWGAVVRATGSGAGCGNHWPLCNGDFLPRHPRLTTLIEFTHRSMSGICTVLVAALLAWTLVARPRGHLARKAAIASAFLLVTEALLGAVLVKGGFVENNASDARVFMQCIHFTNTMLLLAALTATWRLLRPLPALSRQPSLTASPLVWSALILTLVVGATGSVAALADTLFPSPSLRQAIAEDFSSTAPLLVRMRWMHPASVLFSSLAVLILYRHTRSRASAFAVLLLGSQLLLGTLDVVLLAPIVLQVLHLLGADLFWIALVAASVEVLTQAQAHVAKAAPRLQQSHSAI